MQDVYVVKQSIATGPGNSVEATWQRLLKGQSALDAIPHFHADRLTSQKAWFIPDLLPAADENRVCVLAGRVLDQIRPVPPREPVLSGPVSKAMQSISKPIRTCRCLTCRSTIING